MKDPKIKCALRFPGGKSKVIKKYIDPLLPEFGGDYYEPFLGGGSVALWMAQKFPSKTIYINDLNYNLYCFWKTLQQRSEELVEELHKIRDKYDPTNIEKGKFLLKIMNERMDYESDPYEKALAFYVLNKISFSGLTEHNSLSKDAYSKTFNHNNINKLIEISNLMKNMYLSNLDYAEFLSDVQENDFVFLDPPYEIEESLYGKKGELQDSFNHERFAETVKNLNCKWMITYNDNDLIRERFKNYNIYDREYKYCMAFETDESGSKNTRKRNELIIINY